jgi:hypothetical protein
MTSDQNYEGDKRDADSWVGRGSLRPDYWRRGKRLVLEREHDIRYGVGVV